VSFYAEQHQFTYRAYSKGRLVKGEITAPDRYLAQAALHQKGLEPIKISKKTKRLPFTFLQPISKKELCYLTRQLTTLLNAGIPLVQSLATIQVSNPSLQKLITSLQTKIKSGHSFSQALGTYPAYFDDVFCSLIKAGERAGTLEALLEQIATYQEKQQRFKQKIKKALLYPTLVITLACIIMLTLLLYVVPQFKQLFDTLDTPLPPFTQSIIYFSTLLHQHPVFLSLAILMGIISLLLLKKHPKWRPTKEKIILRLPLINQISKKAIIARFSRTLAITFSAGLPIIEALDLSANTCNNLVYKKAIGQAKKSIKKGATIEQAFASTALFPNLVIQMIRVGETSGTLGAMLLKMTDIFEKEVNLAIDGLGQLLEPLIMTILGLLVGGLIIALYLPIFTMGSLF